MKRFILAYGILLTAVPQMLFSQWNETASMQGEFAGDRAGFDVDLNADGTIMAVGAIYHNGARGHVRVFQWDGISWNLLGSDIEGDNAVDFAGYAVSLNDAGDLLAVGIRHSNDNGNESGKARVYRYNGANWVQLGADLLGDSTGDHLGHDVSLNGSGTRLAVSAPHYDIGLNMVGVVRVYEWNGFAWVLQGSELRGQPDDQFGISIDMDRSGNRLAVGAPGNGRSTEVFEWIGGGWVSIGGVISGLGSAVGLNDEGDRLAAGNPNTSDGIGEVGVFLLRDEGWSRLGEYISAEVASDLFGGAVALDSLGTTLAVGAYLNDTNGLDAGETKVFRLVGNTWVQLGADLNPTLADSRFGNAVSLSNNGRRLAVGANRSDANGNNSGETFVFEWTDEYTAIPDNNFEQALIDQGIDSEGMLDGQVLTVDIAGINFLNISVSGITDLTGIEDFEALETLIVSNNALTMLDVSQNQNLLELYCDSNLLTELELSGNPNLEVAWCQFNQITNLELTGALGLRELFCRNNLLTEIEIQDLPNLEVLHITDNELAQLDITPAMAGDSPLTGLYCQNNTLTTLNVVAGGQLTTLWCFDNPELSCIEVQNEADATAGVGIYANWQKDVAAIYSENCAGPALARTAQDEDDNGVNNTASDLSMIQAIVYPNPSRGKLYINAGIHQTILGIRLSMSGGETVMEEKGPFRGEYELDIRSQPPGMYIIYVTTEKGAFFRKVLIL